MPSKSTFFLHWGFKKSNIETNNYKHFDPLLEVTRLMALIVWPVAAILEMWQRQIEMLLTCWLADNSCHSTGAYIERANEHLHYNGSSVLVVIKASWSGLIYSHLTRFSYIVSPLWHWLCNKLLKYILFFKSRSTIIYTNFYISLKTELWMLFEVLSLAVYMYSIPWIMRVVS